MSNVKIFFLYQYFAFQSTLPPFKFFIKKPIIMLDSKVKTSKTFQISLVKQMVMGAGTGLLLISLFLLTSGKSDPAWGGLWMIRPLIIVPLAGALGGLCSYFIFHFRSMVGINKTVSWILSAVVFVIGLWLGTVLGLDGTMWN
jgi:hypothetical protein